MAGIDKTDLNRFEDYIKTIEWAKEVGETRDEYGNKFCPLDFIYYPHITEEMWKENETYNFQRRVELCDTPGKYQDTYIKESEEYYGPDWREHPERFACVCLWNTPTYFDVWLIRNCPLDFIQDRLQEQYGDYEAIKNHTSCFDTYTRNGSPKFSVKYLPRHIKNFRDDRLWWWVQVENNAYLDYNEDDKTWYSYEECKPYHSNTYSFYGNLGKRKLARLMKRWNLPKGTVLKFGATLDGYVYKEFKVTVV